MRGVVVFLETDFASLPDSYRSWRMGDGKGVEVQLTALPDEADIMC